MEGCVVVVVVVVRDVGSRYRKVASECQAPTSRSTSAFTIYEPSLGINIKECLYAAYIYYIINLHFLLERIQVYLGQSYTPKEKDIFASIYLYLSLKEHWNIIHL